MEWWPEVWQRMRPGADAVLSARLVWPPVAVAAAAVLIGPIWRVLRLAVTLVHELGHALTGMLMGRRFTGFVVNGDMSGHAVTVGRTRGFGRALTTWAGYPAPALFAVLLTAAVVHGWSAPLISAVLVVLAISIVRLRSWFTALVLFATIAAVGALWWYRSAALWGYPVDTLQSQVLLGAAVFLLVGAWRQVVAVARSADPDSDPGQLAQLTVLPAMAWVVSFVLVIAGATAAVGWLLTPAVPLP